MFCPKQGASINKRFGNPTQLKEWIDKMAQSETVDPYQLCFLDMEFGEGFKTSGYTRYVYLDYQINEL